MTGAQNTTTVIDVAAGSVAVGTIMEWLPPLAALLTVVWLAIRLYEYIRWVRKGRKGQAP